jgi:hypothetical protein
LLALLLFLQVWMAAGTSKNFGPTGDENAHLTGGYSYWLHNDYRLHSENGNLAQRWVALPLLALRPADPCETSPGWEQASYWPVSEELFFSPQNNLPRMLAWARFMNALLGAAIALLVFFWTKSLFGRSGAWLSFLLAVFCPHLLAHAGLANSDITITLSFLLALLFYWRLLHRISPSRVLLAGLSAGILLTTKFSGVFFLLIAPALLILRLLHPAALPAGIRSGARRFRGLARVPPLFAASFAAALVAAVLVWAAYGFRFSATPDGVTPPPWLEPLAATQNEGGLFSKCTAFARGHHLLPEAWLHGLEYVRWQSGQRRAFLAGDYSREGWPEFFPVAFLIKSTLGSLLLILPAGGLFFLNTGGARWRLLHRLAPLLVFIAVFGVFAVTSPMNIGHRHILPLYPAFYILAGAAAWIGPSNRFRKWALGAAGVLLAWHVASSVAVRPHYLAYFNELIGGPRQGHRFLVDSSLDWGQNLPGLKTWLDKNRGDKPVYLSYFGGDRPSRLDLNAVRTGDANFDTDPRREKLPRLQAGIYCISATSLQQVYAPRFGLWSHAAESRYQALRNSFAPASASPVPDGLDALRIEFDYLRFGRLCHFLRQRQPDDSIGHSILIYHLSEADLDNFLNTPLPGPPLFSNSP